MPSVNIDCPWVFWQVDIFNRLLVPNFGVNFCRVRIQISTLACISFVTAVNKLEFYKTLRVNSVKTGIQHLVMTIEKEQTMHKKWFKWFSETNISYGVWSFTFIDIRIQALSAISIWGIQIVQNTKLSVRSVFRSHLSVFLQFLYSLSCIIISLIHYRGIIWSFGIHYSLPPSF